MEELTYDTLRDAFRLQRESKSKLVSIDENFYEKIRVYLSELEDELSKLEKRKENRFSDKMVENKRKEIKNAYSTLRDFLLLRFKLVSEIAVEDALSYPAVKEGMTKEEKTLFSKLSELLSEEKESVFNGAAKIVKTSHGAEKEGKKEEGKTVKKDSKTVKVKALKKVPPFVGTDMKSYGPYDKGDLIEIPEKNAEILSKKGMVENT